MLNKCRKCGGDLTSICFELHCFVEKNEDILNKANW